MTPLGYFPQLGFFYVVVSPSSFGCADMLRRRYTRESATLLRVLGSRGNIPIGPPKPLRARSLTDKVSTYKVDRR